MTLFEDKITPSSTGFSNTRLDIVKSMLSGPTPRDAAVANCLKTLGVKPDPSGICPYNDVTN